MRRERLRCQEREGQDVGGLLLPEMGGVEGGKLGVVRQDEPGRRRTRRVSGVEGGGERFGERANGERKGPRDRVANARIDPPGSDVDRRPPPAVGPAAPPAPPLAPASAAR